LCSQFPLNSHQYQTYTKPVAPSLHLATVRFSLFAFHQDFTIALQRSEAGENPGFVFLNLGIFWKKIRVDRSLSIY
jgi:hypothetical protein